MNFFNFGPPSRPEAQWFFVGLTSSFPDLGLDDDVLNSIAEPRVCNAEVRPGCKIFRIPKTDPSQGTEIQVLVDDGKVGEDQIDLTDQVMVLQYRGKFHAVDHQCPHSSFPLSRGVTFDIEDFGVVLSAGLTCPKHGWSFDLFSGTADRGNYMLKVWEIELRDVKGVTTSRITDSADNASQTTVKEIWVRRKQKVG